MFMPTRLFPYVIPPQRIRTFLILFAVALTSPLVGLAVFAFNQMANLEEREVERRVLQVAQDLAGDIDRELESATVTLVTLGTSQALAQRDFAAFHAQASRALRREEAAILLVDHSFQQLLNTRAAFGASLPKTSDIETAQKVLDTKQRQVSDVFMGVISRQAVINVEVPVVDRESVSYVLIMALDAARFERMLHSQRLESQWVTGIADNKGIILARSERHADFVGKPLPQELLEKSRTANVVFRTTNVEGQEILAGTVRSQIAGWLVLATVQLANVESSRRQGIIFAATMLVTALGLGAILAYVFATFMASPLQDATNAAAAVGRGEHVVRLASPLVEANTLTAALSAASSELKRRQDQSAFLMRELAHRSKNQLAVVKGMAKQTARQIASVDQFVEQFDQRIQGLAESQDLMVQQNWRGASLNDLVSAHLKLFAASPRAHIEGPPLFLSADAVQNIGFALHELATNACKHGALTFPQGRVFVSWRTLTSDDRVLLEWVERDGPAVQPLKHQGFGFLVITELVARALQGAAQLEFSPDGIRWQLEFPASHVLNKDDPLT
jgi:two-component sensor histidine kinase